ncbi:DUF1000-domain-containing protein, partial [Obba rivulosa]
QTSLLEHLDVSQLTCLNENGEHTLKSIVGDRKRNTSSAYLESDVDEQLLLNVTFNQTTRIRALALQTKPEHAAQAPARIKLILNRPTLGFDDVDDSGVVQELELTPEQVRDGKPVPLRFVRFQAVNTLHIFVESNQGGEEQTRIDAIDVFGTPVVGTRDLSGLRKAEE